MMSVLFFMISVPLMEDRNLERKGEHYEKYMKEVPSSLVPIPPALARKLFNMPEEEKKKAEEEAAKEEAEDDDGDDTEAKDEL
jgi:hypothetical protein